MKTLIRVQNSEGYGMFTAEVNVYFISELRALAERHHDLPNLYDDEKIYNYLLSRESSQESLSENYRFAFKSITQFEKWVRREEVQRLKDHGFKVLKITATEVGESEYQAVFNIDSVVSTEDITDLFID